ncbi:MAG: metal-sensitive transcriptional regulator [Phycisphaerae bacterium]|nr:metal-sensitive transcriptional regulator [Phycisphaerae bacterium]NUQ44696.1 metal-sensitive transcriptional regulator [Phycisphaerae bacterium]
MKAKRPPPACACAAKDAASAGRNAVQVDPQIKADNLVRLRRAEGQVRGIIRMIEEDRYCADIVTQVAAVRESLRAVANGLLQNHLRHCAAAAFRKGSDQADAMYAEIIDLVGRMTR